MCIRDRLVDHTETHAYAQGQQTLLRGDGDIAERLGDFRRERILQPLACRSDLRLGYLLHGGSSRSRPFRTLVLSPRKLPTGADGTGGPPPSKFYENPDNLPV